SRTRDRAELLRARRGRDPGGVDLEDAREHVPRDRAVLDESRGARNTDAYYVPAATMYRARRADNAALGTMLVGWAPDLAHHSSDARAGALRVVSGESGHDVSVEVYLGRLDPDAVRVDLYADSAHGAPPKRHVMARGRKLDAAENAYEYDAHSDAPIARRLYAAARAISSGGCGAARSPGDPLAAVVGAGAAAPHP